MDRDAGAPRAPPSAGLNAAGSVAARIHQRRWSRRITSMAVFLFVPILGCKDPTEENVVLEVNVLHEFALEFAQT